MMISECASRVSRRVFGLTFACFIGLSALPGLALADASANAARLVSSISGELTGLVNAGYSEQQLYGEFERILSRNADLPVVAASVLGRPWKSASASQKKQFISSFSGYISRKYGRQFREFRNAGIDVKGTRNAGRAGVLVTTVINRPGQENLNVDWQISERSGKPRAVNLVIEGVSMLANERAEIGAMLDANGGNLDRLIAALGKY